MQKLQTIAQLLQTLCTAQNLQDDKILCQLQSAFENLRFAQNGELDSVISQLQNLKENLQENVENLIPISELVSELEIITHDEQDEQNCIEVILEEAVLQNTALNLASKPLPQLSKSEILVRAAQKYYEYLDAHNLGLEEIALKGFAKTLEDKLQMSLSKRLINPDAQLMLKIKNTMFEIKGEVEYDELKNGDCILTIQPDSEISAALETAARTEISVLSDLKFLVKNVENFFANCEIQNLAFELPNSLPKIKMTNFPENANNAQKDALNLIFNSSFCYIWGAPGSGKTQIVLANAAAFYAKNDLKTCILAPTNSALEQIFLALIKFFENSEFKLDKLLRLGISSIDFASKYPQCCEQDEKTSIKKRLENALIVGMTLDSFIKRHELFENFNIDFAHYFLDECAFAPLVKALPLCTTNRPIALFGDHKQLMPICEMPESEIKKQPEVSAWNLSSLFMADFFALTNSDFVNLNSVDEPKISNRAALNYTHRYGDNLAQILDFFVYQNGLRGKDEKMEIYCIDSGAKMGDDGKSSSSEVDFITRLFAHLYNNAKSKNELEIGIITPFVAQRKVLKNKISRAEVSTIHSSQGREWENVIFSPVSLHWHLTDSRNKRALYGLNVAVSRVKKRLFIVCDLQFWLAQSNQFLSALLMQSTKINL